MSTRSDRGTVESQSTGSPRTSSQEEIDVLLAQQRDDLATPNPAPAIEEGPHLDDPEVRRLKRQQLRAAGLAGDENHLTEDLKAILAEEVE